MSKPISYKIGMLQINSSFAGQNYLPLSLGYLYSYAQKYSANFHMYEFLPPVYKRMPVRDIVTLYKDTDIVAFSLYMWNYNISCQIAQELKRINPKIVILFGGCEIPSDKLKKFASDHPFIDIVGIEEGEIVFSKFLDAYPDRNWESIPSIAFRRDDNIFITEVASRIPDLNEIPSPFLNGYFDNLLRIYPDERWIGLLESDRGCPFHCSFCSHYDNIILTDLGAMKIGDVVTNKIATKVWSHVGWQDIKHRMKRPYSGKLAVIKLQGRPKIRVTPDHIWLTKDGFKTTSDITTSDKIRLSCAKESTSPVIDLSQVISGLELHNNNVRFRQSKKSVPRYITINNELARLFGLFIAEGHVHFNKNRPNSGCVVWTFGKHEKHLIDETKYLIEKYLGVISHESETNTGIQITVGSNVYAKIFKKWFGKRAIDKQIPLDWMRYPKTIIKSLIQGYLDGDGHFDTREKNRNGRWTASTTSITLAMQLQILLGGLGINCGLYPGKIYNNPIEGRKVNISRPYRLEFYSDLNEKDSKNWIKINYIEYEDFKGDVFSLEVDGEPLYSIYGAESHNCMWGLDFKAKVFKFDLESRIYPEIDWISKNKIEFVYMCNANFGIYKDRDLAVAQKFVANKKKYRYPHAASTQSTKNATDICFDIQKTLSDADMNKGALIAFQSLHEPTLKAIKRSNIKLEAFYDSQARYMKEGTKTFSDIILGLPEETYESFISGLSKLIEMGQHNRVQLNNLCILSNTEMDDEEYINKYQLEVVESELVNVHGKTVPGEDHVPELQKLVISTSTMSRADWVKARVFAYVVGSLHFDKILQIPICMMNSVCNLSFKDIFHKFINIDKAEFPVFGRYLDILNNHALNIQNGGPELIGSKEHLDIWWPPNEYISIQAIRDRDNFYTEIEKIILPMIDTNQDIIKESIHLNKLLFKVPFIKDNLQVELNYNIPEIYKAKTTNSKNIKPVKGKYRYNINRTIEHWDSWDEWYEKVVWWSHKQGKYLYEIERIIES